MAYTVYFAEAAGCGAFNCASVGDALEYIRAWVWEEVEVSGDWMPSPREEEERIAVVGAGISLPPKQKEKATAYQAEARRRKGTRVGWISRKEVA